MKARLEEAILGTIGARQEMVRRSRGESEMYPVHVSTGCSQPLSEGPQEGGIPTSVSASPFPERSVCIVLTHVGVCVPCLFSRPTCLTVFPWHVCMCHPVSSWVTHMCTLMPEPSSWSRVLMFLHICEHAPARLREEPFWEPRERTLAEERHALETDLGPRGQVGVDRK